MRWSLQEYRILSTRLKMRLSTKHEKQENGLLAPNLLSSQSSAGDRGYFWVRAICFFACIPSGAALLAKVYGIASMQVSALALALPSCAALAIIWFWARQAEKKQLDSALTIGFLG